MFLDEFAENIEKGLYDDRDVSRVKCEDQYVRCFVEDRDKLEDSLAMMHESLKWRMEIGLNDLTEDNFNRWMWDLGAVFFHNTDKDGHKILFVKVKEYRKDLNMLPTVKKFFALALEQASLAAPGERIVLLFDMLDTGFANLDMDLIKYCLTCFKFYFPGLLAYILVFEMPWIFNAAWRVIKTWLNQKAVEKIKFVNKPDIQEYINKDQLLEHMGGTDKFQYSYDPTVQKGFLENGKISRSGAKKRVTFAENTVYKSFSNDNIKEEDSKSKSTAVNKNLNINRSALQSRRMNRDENSYIGRLLTISPAEELQFYVEDARESTDVISLTNSLPYAIAFKVKTTSPEKYRVRPSAGIVRPGSCVEVTVYLHNSYAQTISRDKFLIMAIELTEDYPTSVSDLWKTVPRENIMEHRLRCTQVTRGDYSEPTVRPDNWEIKQQIISLRRQLDTLATSHDRMLRNSKITLGLQILTLFFMFIFLLYLLPDEDPRPHCTY
ncbi:motile sperm domain-containing protein 2-like [Liolophura sinensis]|uniref:motile sperm domain-containing protein 2-like n=1 Tax=Liolophura sinensis TaxID=3198878 RepID=UPI00315851C8